MLPPYGLLEIKCPVKPLVDCLYLRKNDDGNLGFLNCSSDSCISSSWFTSSEILSNNVSFSDCSFGFLFGVMCLNNSLLGVKSLVQLNTVGTASDFRVFLTGVHLKSSLMKCKEHTNVYALI